MKIIKAYKQTDTDRDVNIYEKQFHTEHLKPGDTVYRKINGIYRTNKDDVGTVQNILHSGYCTVIWLSTPTDEPEVCKVSDLITTKKYNDMHSDSTGSILTAEAIGVQDFDNNVYAAEDNEPVEINFEDSIDFKVKDLEIEVYNDGTWDYIDSDYKFAQSTEDRQGNWYVQTYDIDYSGEITNELHGFITDAVLRDSIEVVDDFDELLESIIPRYSGRYYLDGLVELKYNVNGTLYPETNDRGNVVSTFELNDVTFNKTASKRTFKISISEAI